MTRRRWHAEERGQGLLELLVSMPLVVILLIALGTAFAFGVRAYVFLMGDWELQKQVAFAMERMTTDLRYAENATVSGDTLRVLCRMTNETAQWVEYTRTTEDMPRMMRSSQPMTGESSLGSIAMTRFTAETVGPRTIFLRLCGENRLTGHTYELETAVTWTGKGS
ncbi:MAG: hypothetical protein IK136_03100 [Oscillospiraceae bacterium]|nr:hypothetical protein [Oscillospiraceae bacterium]